MEKNLEKLFSNVLLNWLKCKNIADEQDGKTEFGSACGMAAYILKRCLVEAGFDTDIKDYVSELALKGECGSEKAS